MRLICFDDHRIGVVKGDRVVDVTPLLDEIPRRDALDLMPGLIARFDAYREAIAARAEAEPGVPLAGVKVRPPIPRPRQIDCMAVNYMEHGTLKEKPAINAFHKSPSAVIGHGEAMVLPDIPAAAFEGEAELAVIIGKRASHVSEEAAMEHVFGYTNFIDGSARGLPPATNFFFQVKSRDTFAPMGPFIVTADEVRDPQALDVRLWVNGELRQDFPTSDMAHRISRCIAFLSSIHTLEPGDVVATGTNHQGLSALQDGDVVELECEGMGRLRIDVRDDLKRSWSRETRAEGRRRLEEAGETPPPLGSPAKQLSGKYAET